MKVRYTKYFSKKKQEYVTHIKDRRCPECYILVQKFRTEHRKDRVKEIRLSIRKIKASGCSICGYNRCITALEFHHNNGSNKFKNISQITTFNQLKKELEKCTLVCANCHREIEAGIMKNGKAG